MILEPAQQLDNVIKECKNVLVMLPADPGGDAVGAAWAFYFFLKQKNIEATLAFSLENGNVEKYGFLPRPEKISNNLLGARDFVLAFATKYNKIMAVRQEELPDELRIYITPERGSIDPRDFSFIPAKFNYDLVVVLGSPDKESLGRVYEDNPDIFYEVPVVNIDNNPENENFGQLNIIDIAASSVAEILAGLLEKIGGSLNEQVAECLLTGIIEATNNFQKKNTSPKALKLAAELMASGADQQKIVRHLFKTQPLSLLKLWGRVMARLQWEEASGTVWAPVLLEDFVQARSSAQEISQILDKVRENYANGRIFFAAWNERLGQVLVLLKFSDQNLLKVTQQKLGGKIKGDLLELEFQGEDPVTVGQNLVEKLNTL